MVNSKASSLSLSTLSCQIIDYKAEIAALIKESNKGPLYTDFVQKFLSYIPVDYRALDKLPLFCEFADEAFEFFKNRKAGVRKTEIRIAQLDGNPAITILLLNDNQPFIIDSLSCLLSHLGIQARFILHPVIFPVRSSEGELEKIEQVTNGPLAESLVYIKILGQFDSATLKSITAEIEQTLTQVNDTNSSWQPLLAKIENLAKDIEANATVYTGTDLPLEEITSFLRWLGRNNFTFLGSAEFDADTSTLKGEIGATSIWQGNTQEIRDIINFSGNSVYKDRLIILGRINRISPVHRNTLVDYILIKNRDSNGEYKSGTIIFGLYGSAIYYQSIKDIPILRQKLNWVLEKAGFPLNGYNSKKMRLIIESLPREALIQIDVADLYCMCLHMLSSMMTSKLKIFIQQDWSASFINVLIFLPRDRLTPEVHNATRDYLSKKLKATILSDYVTEVVQNFSHLFVTLAVKEKNKVNFSLEEVEKELNEISTNWSESFYQTLISEAGEYQALFDFNIYESIFPSDYRHKFNAQTALEDLNYLKRASTNARPTFNLIILSPIDFQLKIYSPLQKLALSNILPSIENLGFKAIDEQTFAIKEAGSVKKSWIYEFILSAPVEIQSDAVSLKSNVEDALDKMTAGSLASDSLSKLVVLSGFNWLQVKLFKSLTRYLHQTGFTYGKGYVQLTVIKHYAFTELLLALFEAKFNPENSSEKLINSKRNDVLLYLDNVTSSAEDKVLRAIYHLIEAMTRTNYYQAGRDVKPYLSFKFNSHNVPGLPLPVPFAEIFVYSNEFEGIHLRGGRVSRGGIRWSDRGEDYRTEVLGLMKAQMTKNSVIVPVGSKGGFFLLFSSDNFIPGEYMNKAIESYKNFLRGLLDITDNIVNGKIVQPTQTVIYDEQDPYLVVAADRGTATFSDYANNVSAEYNYWLGDAFASGGSAGYDHKKMGITAKGAWISVQRHFEEMGIDVQKDVITVVGIGDMSGDVFGNGLLRSKTVKLVAAFNHKHIFIDPDPDPEIGFKERQRLFNLSHSNWSDYDADFISPGGGIFDRASKSIALSNQIKELLKLGVDELTPDELIRAILKAPVDLLWNGGIGTYIKASTENHVEIGDKTNDNLRCNGGDINAKVVAEGGNLGVSQLGRIEYSRKGGRINTDFIDNSAGVDCSDHEVNIKIALNGAMRAGKLTLSQRNDVLAQMTGEVEELVLADNYKQTRAITIAQLSPAVTVELFSQLISTLEGQKLLDPKLEFIPSKAELNRRSAAKEKMERPELAVLLSYSKMAVYDRLVAARGKDDITTDEYFQGDLIDYFPALMRKKFADVILSHPLRREIIITIATNKIINQLGGAILNTIERETSAPLSEIIRSFQVVCEIFDLDNLWTAVDLLPSSVDMTIKIEMFTDLTRIMRRGIAWFVKNLEYPIDILKTINEFKEAARRISHMVGPLLIGDASAKFDYKSERYKSAGADENLANSIATLDSLISTFDIINIAKQTTAKDTEVAKYYFATGYKFNIDWLRKSCEKQIDDSYWDRLSIQSIKDDLYDKQKRLTIKIMNQSKSNIELDSWMNNNKENVSIFMEFVEAIKLQEKITLNMIILANKKLEMFLRKLG